MCTRSRRRRQRIAALVTCVIIGFSLSATAQTRRRAGQRPVPSPRLPTGFHELAGTDANLPFDDLAPLDDLIDGAPFVALGEPVHTSSGFTDAKHRVLRYLVQERGFRVFAIETSWEDADLVGAYVAAGTGSAEQAVLQGLSRVWRNESLLAIVEWMRSWNVTHTEDPLYFFGFDVFQPDQDGPALIAYLQRVHGDPASLVTRVNRCAGVGVPRTPVDSTDHQLCIAALDEIQVYLEIDRDRIIAATSEEELEWAWVRLVGLQAFQGYALGVTVGDHEAANESRDWGMAEAFLRIYRLRYAGLKTVMSAHNYHVAQNTPVIETDAEFGGARAMGTHLAVELGTDYAPICLAAYRMGVYWPWVIPEPTELVPTSGVEPRLHAYGRAALLVDAAAPALCPPDELCQWTWPDIAMTTFDWAMWRLVFDPPEQFRAVVFLDESRRMVPLE